MAQLFMLNYTVCVSAHVHCVSNIIGNKCTPLFRRSLHLICTNYYFSSLRVALKWSTPKNQDASNTRNLSYTYIDVKYGRWWWWCREIDFAFLVFFFSFHFFSYLSFWVLLLFFLDVLMFAWYGRLWNALCTSQGHLLKPPY